MTMAFASLSLPPMEEAMEMSSPAAGHHFDGDIDIDFDDYGGNQINDDEHMLEDGDSMRPGTAVTDDMMADIDHAHVTSVPNTVEEEMQDSDGAPLPVEQQMNDEELIDYEDEFYPDQPQEAPLATTFQVQDQTHIETKPVDAPAAEIGLLPEVNDPTDHDQVDEEILRGPENVAGETARATVDATVDATVSEGTKSAPEEPSSHDQSPLHEKAETVREEDTSNNIAAHHPPASDTQVDDELSKSTAGYVGAAAQTPSPADEDQANTEQDDTGSSQRMTPRHLGTIDVGGSFATDAPPTPTDQTLHAMSISFGDYQWPLFKSRSQPDGLLKDDNLLNVSLTDLLHNIRERLALKVSASDMITETRDLVLNFDVLGLMVAESSLHASATSLNDVLGVYLNLHENDGTSEQDAPPLLMTLTTQLNFSNTIASLKQLAATGAGLPSVPDHADEDAANFDQEDDANAEYLDETATQPEEGETNDDQEQYPGEVETQDDLTGQIYEYYEEDREEYENYEDHEQAVDARKDAPGLVDGDDESSKEYSANGFPAEQNTLLAEVTELSGASNASIDGTDQVADPKSDDNSNGVSAHATETGIELHPGHSEDDYPAALDEDQSNSLEDHFDDAVSDREQYGEADPDTEVLQLASDDLLESGQPHNEGNMAAKVHDPTASTPEHHVSSVDSVEHESAHNDGTAANDNDPTARAGDEEQLDATFDLLDDDGNEPFHDNDDSADVADQFQALDEDDIGFDLDDEDIAPASPSPAASTPRHGKRTLEETVDDEDHIDFDEPELKKPRAD